MKHSAVFRLVVGLGNPGDRYRGTRHNVGFEVVEELARRSACSFRFEPRWNAEVAECGGRLLMKPSTFMNLSGEAAGSYARYFKLAPVEVLVVLDDSALELGDLRIRSSGSAGGHNGLESILVHFGTEAVPRLRVGIGAPPPQIPLDEYVLGKFLAEERVSAENAIMRAADAVEFANAHGIDAAMNTFNQRKQP